MSRDERISWFHGKVSREYAEDLIKEGKYDKIKININCNV